MTAEQIRLDEASQLEAAWKKWRPYLSERQWGTVREDYSENGDAWNFFTHDHARSRAYRLGEDGIDRLLRWIMHPRKPTHPPRLVIPAMTLVVFIAAITTAQATAIGIGAFGPGAVIESFEGVSPGANSPQLPGTGILKPGVIEPFTFGSGVVLTAPIPNVGVGEGQTATGVSVDDFSIGPAGFGLGENGHIDSANDVPDGSAFLALDAYPGPIEFTFPSDVLRVGAFVAGDPGFVTLSAFDKSGGLLQTLTLTKGSASNWATTFIGLERSEGIRTVTFSDSNIGSGFNALVVDKLTFETTVPEPSSMLLVAIGLVAIRFKQSSKQPRNSTRSELREP